MVENQQGEPLPLWQEQLLVDYQIAHRIADHEVQTMYLTFAIFFPLFLTAAASLLVALFSGKIQNAGLFLGLGAGGFVTTSILTVAWWRVANRRQENRQRMFNYQLEIAERLGAHMRLQETFRTLEPGHMIPGWLWLERLILPFVEDRGRAPDSGERVHRADLTFVSLMRLSLWVPVGLWLAVLIVGAFKV